MRVTPCFGYLALLIVLVLTTYICSAVKVTDTDCPLGSECTAIAHAECDGSKCKCSTTFEEDSNDGSTCTAIASAQGSNQQVTKVKVTDTDCPLGTECAAIAHAECDGSKCKCSTTFEEDSNDGSTCSAIASAQGSNQQATKTRVSLVGCPDGGKQCDTIKNAACVSQTHKCKCDAGYAEGNPDTSTCVKIIGGACTGNGPCGDAHSVCKNDVCECAEGFGDKNNACTAKLDSKQCAAKGTECNSPPHAECDTAAKKCRCSAGFKMNVDTCEADNAGVSTTLAFTVLAIPVVLAMKEVLENVM